VNISVASTLLWDFILAASIATNTHSKICRLRGAGGRSRVKNLLFKILTKYQMMTKILTQLSVI